MRIKKGFHIDSFSFGYNSNAKNPNISDSFPVGGQRWIGRAKVSSLKNRTVYSDYFVFAPRANHRKCDVFLTTFVYQQKRHPL